MMSNTNGVDWTGTLSEATINRGARSVLAVLNGWQQRWEAYQQERAQSSLAQREPELWTALYELVQEADRFGQRSLSVERLRTLLHGGPI